MAEPHLEIGGMHGKIRQRIRITEQVLQRRLCANHDGIVQPVHGVYR